MRHAPRRQPVPAGPGDPAAPGTPGPGLLGRTGRACYRHRWLTLAAWLAAVACLIVLWMRFGAGRRGHHHDE
ncbi:MAG TPA: hypothetical protein VGJ19_07780 [Streptosporangiaceae bacterium]